jgi:hypothetical protein
MSAGILLLFVALQASPSVLEPMSIQEATTEQPHSVNGVSVTSWTVVSFEGFVFNATAMSETAVFLGDQPCFLAWKGSTAWCIVPHAFDVSRHRLRGPFMLEIGQESDPRFRASLRESRDREGVALSGVALGPPLRAKTLSHLLRSLSRD